MVRVIDRWNGTTLVRQSLQRWTGTALVTEVLESDFINPPTPQGQPIEYPFDSGIVIMTAAPYNLDKTGVADCTAAINQALADYGWKDADGIHRQLSRQAPVTLYFPAGTYRVTGTLAAPGSSISICGEGEARTIFKLADNLTDFASTATPRAVFQSGAAGSPAQGNAAFSNYYRNFTVDVGSGNAGAVGIIYWAANCGSLQNVTIRSSDAAKRGSRGLTIESTSGPAMIQNLTVDGFQYGIWTDTARINNFALTNIKIRNCTVAAIRNQAKNLQIEALTVDNCPTVLQNVNAGAWALITDATLTGRGVGTAITTSSAGMIFLRNITAPGWSNLVTQGTTQRFVGKTTIAEWSSAASHKGTAAPVAYTELSAVRSMNLPLGLSPAYEYVAPALWANVRDYGATGTGTVDDRQAFQDAIDSGAEVVYAPYGQYVIDGTLFMRGNCKRLHLMFSRFLRGATGSKVSVGASSGSPDVVWIEDASASVFFELNSARSLVVRNISSAEGTGGSGNNGNATFVTTATATGNLYVENTGARATLDVNGPAHVWTRQTNRETTGATYSGGAVARVFADNIEQKTSLGATGVFDVSGAGTQVEINGGTFDNLGSTTAWPPGSAAAFRASAGAKLSYVMAAVYRSGGFVDHWVSDRNGSTVLGDMFDSDLVKETGSTSNDQRVFMPLYTSPSV